MRFSGMIRKKRNFLRHHLTAMLFAAGILLQAQPRLEAEEPLPAEPPAPPVAAEKTPEANPAASPTPPPATEAHQTTDTLWAQWAKLSPAELQAALQKALEKDANEASAIEGLLALSMLTGNWDEEQAAFNQAILQRSDEGLVEMALLLVSRFDDHFADVKSLLLNLKLAQDDPKLSGPVRREARRALAIIQAKRGGAEQVAEIEKGLGRLDKWSFIGPVTSQDFAGFSKTFEVETNPKIDKTEGINRKVSWFVTPGPCPRPRFDRLFEPGTQMVAFARTFIQAPKAGPALLEFGYSGAATLYLNGHCIYQTPLREKTGKPAVNEFAPAKKAIPITLNEGWNRLLVKMTSGEKPAIFEAVLCDAKGETLSDCKISATLDDKDFPAETPEEKEAKRPNAPAAGTLPQQQKSVEDLQTAAKTATTATLQGGLLRQMVRLILMQEMRRLGSASEPDSFLTLQKAQKQFKEMPPLALAQLLANPRPNERYEAVLPVLTAHPEYQLLRREVWATLLDRRLPYDVTERARALGPLEKTPDILRLTLTKAFSQQDEKILAREILTPLTESHPGSIAYLSTLWHLLPESAERDHLTEQMSALQLDSPWTRQLAKKAFQENKETEAFALYKKLTALDSYNPANYLDQAALYRATDHFAEGAAILEIGLASLPQDPDLLKQRAHLKRLAGAPPEEVNAAFQAVLAVKPSEPKVQEYLDEKLNPQTLDFYKPYRVDAAALLKSPELQNPRKDKNFLHVLDQKVIRLHPDGTQDEYRREIYRIQTERGAETFRSEGYGFYYSPSRQKTRVLQAKLVLANGQEIPAEGNDSSEGDGGSEGNAVMMQDRYGGRHFRFPKTAVGSTIYLEYILQDTQLPLYGDYLHETAEFSGENPKLKTSITLIAPENRKIYYNFTQTPLEPKMEAAKEPGMKAYTWEQGPVEGIDLEYGCRPEAEFSNLLSISTFASWDEVGAWFNDLAKDQIDLGDDGRQSVRTGIEKATTKMEKLQKIQEILINDIRYESISLGRNGYKPHRACDTLREKKGDCKDTAVLLKAMLKEAGIEAKLVLVRAGGGRFEKIEPGPAIFNHAICFVPDVDGKDYWVDGTTDYFALNEVPSMDQGSMALVIDDSGAAKLTLIPVQSGNEVFCLKQTLDIQLSATGEASIKLDATPVGELAGMFRQGAAQPDRFIEALKNYFIAKSFTGATIQDFDFGPRDTKAINQPVFVKASLQVKDLAKTQGDRLALKAYTHIPPHPRMPETYTAIYGAITERKLPMQLFRLGENITLNIQLPTGTKIDETVKDKTIETPWVIYKRTIVTDEAKGTISVQIEANVLTDIVAPADYPEFKKTCAEIDAANKEEFLLQCEK